MLQKKYEEGEPCVMPDKNEIRKRILERRASLPADILERAGKKAAERLMLMEEYEKANTVMLYMDFRNEVPTTEMIEIIRSSEKKLLLPLINEEFRIVAYEVPKEGPLSDYLITSKFGIEEPNPVRCIEADPASIDLIIVPGTVFDQFENRIGCGKGCYDRYLAQLPSTAFKLALAYDFQVLQCIPADPTDIRMDKIMTLGTN